MRLRRTSALIASIFAAASSAIAQAPVQPGPPLRLADLDTTVNACTDFYQYASGGWLKANPDPAADPDTRKLGTFYASCMEGDPMVRPESTRARIW